MKKIISILLLLVSVSVSSQNFEDSWEGFFSFNSISDISQGNGRLYVASENAIYTFDLFTEEVNTITSINGLSGEPISTIHYSEEFELLLVGHSNGLIEVVFDNQEQEVLTVVDILDQTSVPPNRRNVNDFFEFDGVVYIAAGYGISVYDLAALEFGDTYLIGDLGVQINVTQTTVLGSYIYASSSEGGVRRALVDNDNLIDFSRWTTILSGNIQGVQTLGESIFIASNNGAISQFNEATGLVGVSNVGNTLVDFKSFDEILTITTQEFTRSYSEGFVLESSVNSLPNFNYTLRSGFSFDRVHYLGTQEDGLLAVPFGTNTATQVLPNGPLFNTPFAVEATANNVWVCFGDVTVSFNPFPLTFRGVSHLVDDAWFNIPREQLPFATDLVQVTINPLNPSEVYFSSFQKGLLRIRDQQVDILFDETNSPLERIFVGPNNADAGIRIFGGDYDRDNNFWFVQSRTAEGLIRLDSSDQFSFIDISSITSPNQLALTKLKISREGFIFFGSTSSGLIAYDPNLGVFGQIREGQGNGNLSANNVRALAFDNNNRLWIGTIDGLRVLFNVPGIFDPEGVESQPIIIEENGVGQELLFTQSITDIEVDGANNKWVSTATSGVFLLSPNGQETLQRFTSDNSPLPSNNVQDMTIDPISGRVYFATINGLVAFDGNFTQPRENLEEVFAFPNPVRPGFTGSVTIDGLTANANVKITDIEGNLVFETTSEGGSVQWDTTAFGQYKVASGVYLILITTGDALETKVSKIMVVR